MFCQTRVWLQYLKRYASIGLCIKCSIDVVCYVHVTLLLKIGHSGVGLQYANPPMAYNPSYPFTMALMSMTHHKYDQYESIHLTHCCGVRTLCSEYGGHLQLTLTNQVFQVLTGQVSNAMHVLSFLFLVAVMG